MVVIVAIVIPTPCRACQPPSPLALLRVCNHNGGGGGGGGDKNGCITLAAVLDIEHHWLLI
jgi:hypothetical protein